MGAAHGLRQCSWKLVFITLAALCALGHASSVTSWCGAARLPTSGSAPLRLRGGGPRGEKRRALSLIPSMAIFLPCTSFTDSQGLQCLGTNMHALHLETEWLRKLRAKLGRKSERTMGGRCMQENKKHMWTHTHKFSHAHTCTHDHTHTQNHKNTHTHTHKISFALSHPHKKLSHTHKHTLTHTLSLTHTDTHTHTHTHIHR